MKELIIPNFSSNVISNNLIKLCSILFQDYFKTMNILS